MNENKIVVKLDKYEFNIVVHIINEKRNSLINQKKDTTLINEILEKIIESPKNKKIFKRKVEYER